MVTDRTIQSRSMLILTCMTLLLLSACATAPKVQTDPIISRPQVRHPSATLGNFIAQSAASQLGRSYQFGGKTPRDGFDCSGLTMYSYQVNGIAIPRQARDQFKHGYPINRAGLRNGDLVFFTTYKKGASHVGIYIGNGLFIHAPNSRKNVETESLANAYYKKRYLGARRYW